MSAITTHILDTARGQPAAGVPLLLEVRSGVAGWTAVSKGVSDSDGRARLLETVRGPGTYRLTFDTGAYFSSVNAAGFYPEVQVVFEIADAATHHHVPLLLSPFGYSTYRGS
ncbi:MAG: hydroxyisourate hydrolase [Acidobacteria bacterium]|nr:hydroxyisourate hydrolase [Acidobacteriota bacterium]MCA1609943.1 hydroxyisourate hydrolase [Acidobacteriota bacterium]